MKATVAIKEGNELNCWFNENLKYCFNSNKTSYTCFFWRILMSKQIVNLNYRRLSSKLSVAHHDVYVLFRNIFFNIKSCLSYLCFLCKTFEHNIMHFLNQNVNVWKMLQLQSSTLSEDNRSCAKKLVFSACTVNAPIHCMYLYGDWPIHGACLTSETVWVRVPGK